MDGLITKVILIVLVIVVLVILMLVVILKLPKIIICLAPPWWHCECEKRRSNRQLTHLWRQNPRNHPSLAFNHLSDLALHERAHKPGGPIAAPSMLCKRLWIPRSWQGGVLVVHLLQPLVFLRVLRGPCPTSFWRAWAFWFQPWILCMGPTPKNWYNQISLKLK